MPFIQSTADALPYIDAPPSTEAMASANALIQAEMASDDQSSIHPSIAEFEEAHFSELVAAEHARLASGQSRAGGIDLTRYEALDAAEKGDAEAWKSALAKAYASMEYLNGREINLGLLETYGKNAWLIANSQLEDILRSLEREIEASKVEFEQVEQARRTAQENVAGEMQSLGETWRKGIGRMIETQAAVEELKQQILQGKRAAAA